MMTTRKRRRSVGAAWPLTGRCTGAREAATSWMEPARSSGGVHLGIWEPLLRLQGRAVYGSSAVCARNATDKEPG